MRFNNDPGPPLSRYPVGGFPSALPQERPPKDLAAGIYWKSGLTMSPPTEGQGWTSGLPGLASGASIVLLRVLASPIVLAAMSIDISYRGNVLDEAMGYWDGDSVETATPDTPAAWALNAGYASANNTRAFVGGPTSSQFYWAGRESNTTTPIQGDAFTATA